MPDPRPGVILLVYLVAMAGIVFFTGQGDTAPGKDVAALQSGPKISVDITGDDTATVEETMTCSITVSLDSAGTTASTVAVSDMVSVSNGASLQVIDADPSFESTEPASGGGTKVNWGSFRLVDGESLRIKMRLKPTAKGTILNTVSAGAAGAAVRSQSLLTLIAPAQEPTSTVSTAFNANPYLNSSLLNKGTSSSTTYNSSFWSTYLKSYGTSLNSSGSGSGSSTGSHTSSSGTTSSTTIKTGASGSTTGKGKEAMTTTGSTTKAGSNDRISIAGFHDVYRGDWCEDFVASLAYKKIINGYADSTFRPGGTVNRAEFTAFIVRGLGSDARGPEPFTDVKQDDWFHPTVAAAYNLDLVTGVSGDRFAPTQKLTREQASVISIKVAKVTVDTDAQEIDRWLQGFSDRDKLSAWARPYVAASVKYNLLKGYPDTRFDPGSTITRAEASALIYRIFFEKRSRLLEPPDYVKSLGAGTQKTAPGPLPTVTDTRTID